VSKRQRLHTSDEFGKSPVSGGEFSGMDAPLIGAPSAIIVDGLTEAQSGVTPPPPPVSVKAIAVALVVMFALGAVLLALVVPRLGIPSQVTDAANQQPYASGGPGSASGYMAGDLILMGSSGEFGVDAPPSPGHDPDEPPLTFAYDRWTAFLLNGRPISAYESTYGTMTVYDVGSWPVNVDYVPGDSDPLAIKVNATVPETWIRQRLATK
jgi:hypothetical protein